METRELTLTNRDGKRLLSTLRLPEGESRGTALVLHGLGGWREQPVITAIAEILSKEGYRTLAFDAASGACGPDGDFFTSTTTEYIEDLEDVITQIRASEWYQGPLLLCGHSMGGLVALHYASQHSAEVEKLLLIAPAVSWKMMWWGQVPFFIPWLLCGERPWPGPKGSKLFLSRKWIFDFFTYDGYHDAQLVTVPTLIVSAQQDHTVAHPREHKAFARMFKKAHHVVVPGAGHAFVGNEKELTQSIKEWVS